MAWTTILEAIPDGLILHQAATNSVWTHTGERLSEIKQLHEPGLDEDVANSEPADRASPRKSAI